MMTDLDIRDAPDQQRFETEVDGKTAVVDYRVEGDRIRLTHTSVPPALEGRGIGSALARHALESARDRDLRVWPECPFIASYIERHPEYLELVDDEYPDRARLESSAN